METLIEFLTQTLVLEWLQGQRVLGLFDDYILSQPDHYVVLMLYGMSVLALLGVVLVVKWILKVSAVWLKAILIIGLIYYLFVIVLGVDVLGLFGL